MIKLRSSGGHGIELPDLDIGLDTNSQKMKHVFISHAHADHVPRDRSITVVATPPTATFMRIRGFKGQIQQLNFGEKLYLDNASVTLLPAGHILGSAMIYVESDAGSLLYSGDCKTPPAPCTEGFKLPESADTLIIEGTFALPVYRWPSMDALFNRICSFAQEALSRGEVPVFLAYNLGKAQELLYALKPLGITTQIHGAGYPLCQAYEQHGVDLGSYETYNRETLDGKALITPGSSLEQPMIRNLRKKKVAYVSGWATHEARRQQMIIDERIPLSDHLDFFELLKVCKSLNPKKVLITHSPNPDVAIHYLREMGMDAGSLSMYAKADDD